LFFFLPIIGMEIYTGYMSDRWQGSRLNKQVKEISMKKILFTSLLFVMSYILMAQQRGPGEFAVEIWQVSQRHAAVIVGYNGASVHIVIPEQINGYPVAGIGNNVFRSRCIESVRFPSTLVFIGDYAFYDNKLVGVSLPAGVISIGIGAFDNNIISRSAPTPPSAATYVRSYTIEPAHSGDTIYTQRPTTPSQTVITVAPGYNPVQSVQQPPGIVTVQDSRTLIPAPVGPRTTVIPVYPGSAPASTYRAPIQQQSYIQTPLQGYVQQVAPMTPRSANKLRIVPENAVDLNTGMNPMSVFGPEEVEEIQIYSRGVYPVWRNPQPR
jgi:hypothetical protein